MYFKTRHLYCLLFRNIDPAEAHLPNLKEPESVVDFLCLCAIGILSNVLDPRTYQYLDVPDSRMWEFHKKHDVNAIPHNEREAYVYTRALSYQLVEWFFNAYEVTTRGGIALADPWRLVFAEPLADIVSVLHDGAAILDEYHPGVREEDFQRQLMLCFEKEELIIDLLQSAPDSMSLLWSFDPCWVISAKGTMLCESMFGIFILP